MDNVCHTLTGAAIGHAGLAKRSALSMSTLMIASNLPDIDVAVFATDTLPMAFRRGWTHGVLAQAVLPLIFAGVMVAWDRVVRGRLLSRPDRARPGVLIALSYVGTLSHVFLDFLNSYGVRLLMPFSNRWFYGDALYIVDPWMYLMLGGGIVLAYGRRRDRRSDPERSARIGLALAGVYVALMLFSNLVARSAVADGLQRAGVAATTRFMVTPVLVNPFRREVFVDLGDRYERGVVWFEPLPHFRPAGFGIDTHLQDPLVTEASQLSPARGFLQWARFPYASVQTAGDGERVWFNDYRYSGQAPTGWSAVNIDLPSRPPTTDHRLPTNR